MGCLNKDWRPGFGTIYTWFAMDRYGRIAVMVNNCFGDLPKVLLGLDGVDSLLDSISEFIWGESSQVSVYPEEKKAVLRLICFLRGVTGGLALMMFLQICKRTCLIAGFSLSSTFLSIKGFMCITVLRETIRVWTTPLVIRESQRWVIISDF